jgi:hypothetical protein
MDRCKTNDRNKTIEHDRYVYEVKADGQVTRTWCKRRGIEEQRLYDITKLRRQFQDILRVDTRLLNIYIVNS